MVELPIGTNYDFFLLNILEICLKRTGIARISYFIIKYIYIVGQGPKWEKNRLIPFYKKNRKKKHVPLMITKEKLKD